MALGQPIAIQVIGGGILGLLIALFAAEKGLAVLLYRLTDHAIPRADSLRNHAWKQSGLLYARELPLALLKRMNWSGRALFDKFAMPQPRTRGVFRVQTEEAAKRLLEDAATLRIGSQVSRIPDDELRDLLGPFYRPDEPCFWVPDSPFPEGELITIAREAAKRAGVKMVELKEGVVLRPEPQAIGGIVVEVAGQAVESIVTVIAAGAHTPGLLSQLGLQHPLRVFQSPLLVADTPQLLQVPLLHDCATGLSVVRHPPEPGLSDDRLVIGNRHRRPLSNVEIGQPRSVKDDEVDSILDILPPEVRDAIPNQMRRYTAGFKTEARDRKKKASVKEKTSVRPWHDHFEQFPGLIAAVPGKATFALWAAELVVEMAHAHLSTTSGSSRSSPLGDFSDLPDWTARIHMHHAVHYDHLNEAAEERDRP